MKLMEIVLTVIVILGALYFYDSIRIRPLIARDRAVQKVVSYEEQIRPDIQPVVTEEPEVDIDVEALSQAVWDARRCLYRASQIIDGLE